MTKLYVKEPLQHRVDNNQVLNLPEIFPILVSRPSSRPGPSVR